MGQITAVGHRNSDRYYRVYSKRKGECLRFEFEHKHRKTLNLYYSLLKRHKLDELEQFISYEFMKITFELFSSSQQPEKIDWLAQRLRPFQNRNSLSYSGTVINMHYINQCPIKNAEKSDLVTLFQVLMYLKSLKEYETAILTSKFRRYKFPVREFIEFAQPGRPVYHYHLNKAKDFFNYLTSNIIFEFLTDESYRMLVSIPEAYARKVQNQWIAEIWVADELFQYLYPFLLPDYFKKKLTTDEFLVVFEIIQIFSVDNMRKEFNIPRFFELYPSKINGTRKKKIKDSFLLYIKVLQKQGIIQDQVLFPLLSCSNPKSVLKLKQLQLHFRKISKIK